MEGGEGAHREGENTGRDGNYGKGAEGEIRREERTRGESASEERREYWDSERLGQGGLTRGEGGSERSRRGGG